MTITLLLTQQLLVAAVLAGSAYAAGRQLTRRLQFSSLWEEGAVCGGLGMGALGTGFFLLAAAGQLKAPVVAVAIALLHAVSVPLWRSVFQRLRLSLASRPRRFLLAAAALYGTPVLALGLYPPAAFDETMYHLPYATGIAAAHHLVFQPDLRFPLFPQVNEILSAAILLFAGDVATHVVELLAMLAGAAALVAWGKAIGRPRAGFLAAALWAGNPLVCFLAGTSYIDLGLSLFVLLAFFAWDNWNEGRGNGWLWASGAAAGFAAASKYTGLYFVVVLLVLTVCKSSPRPRWKSFAAFSALCAACVGLWYLWIYLETRNPVFPYMSSVFGRNAWSDGFQMIGNRAAATASAAGAQFFQNFVKTRSDLAHLLTIPWRFALDRAALKGMPPISIFYLPLLPLLFWRAVSCKRTRRHLAVIVIYLVGLGIDEARLLLPLASLLSLECGASLEWLATRLSKIHSRWPHPAAVVLFGLLAAPGPLYSCFQIWKRGPIPSTLAQRDAYLTGRIPPYAAVSFLNRAKGAQYCAYALYGENLHYFAKGRLRGEWNGPASYDAFLSSAGDGASLYARLRAWGAQYLIVNRQSLPANLPGDVLFQSHFRPILHGKEFDLFELR